jgi:hypothetical protein
MSELSKQALKVENNTSFPNNNNGAITPTILRDFNTDMIDSLVDEIGYTADSASWNQQINALEVFTASFTGSATNTGSLLLTASFDNNTRNLTFTKGDATTFNVNIPDVSGSTINTGSLVTTASFNAYTSSNDQKVNSLIAATGSFATTGSNTFKGDQLISGSNNHLLFQRDGAGDIFRIGTSDNGNTYDFTVTGSANQQLWLIDNQGGTYINTFIAPIISLNNVRLEGGFTASLQDGYAWVGNSAGKNTQVPTSSFGGGAALPAGVLSSSVTNFVDYSASVDTRINNIVAGTGFATTGSNTFTGNQTINKNGGEFQIIDPSNPQYGTTSIGISGPSGGLTFKQSGSIIIEGVAGTKNLTFYGTGSFVRGIALSDSDFVAGATIRYDTTNDVVIIEKDGTFKPSLNIEGTLTASLEQGYVWVGNASGRTVTVATSSFGGGGGTGFATTGSNTFTGDQTLIDNAGNFFTISDASGSMMLVAKGFTSASAHISASSAGTGNFIFKTNNNTGDTIVSGSGNIFTNPSGPTSVLFKRYIGGSGNIMLNASNVPQISGSMAFSPTMNNNYFGGNSQTLTMRGPVSSSAWTISANSILGAVNIGQSAANHAQGIVSGLSMIGNNINGTLAIVANKANLTQGPSLQNNNIGGQLTLTPASSSIQWIGNTTQGTISLTNEVSGSGATIVSQSNSIYVNQNIVGGQLTINASGTELSDDPTGQLFLRTLERNIIAGHGNNVRLNGATSSSLGLVATAIIGNNLTITGSNSSAAFLTPQINYGSAFFGRYNAQDGNRALSAQTVFAVGTGDSTTRKTGFLIDSGSNTFIEGTLNVSGSTTLSGSLYIQSASAFPTQIGTSLVTWDATTGQVGQATTATLISSSFSAGEFYSMTTLSGSAGVSASINLPNTAISNGVSIQNNSQITVQNTGVYNIQFSAQADAFDGADTIWIWFKKNGTNITDSASKLIMQNNTAAIMTVNIFDNAVSNDYFEVVWQNNAGYGKLISDAATGNIPGIPSIIVTVNQVK